MRAFPYLGLGGVMARAIAAASSSDGSASAETFVNTPKPNVTAPTAGKAEDAVFAGGCFWGVEGVFSHMKGVISVPLAMGAARQLRPNTRRYPPVQGTRRLCASCSIPPRLAIRSAARLFFGRRRSNDTQRARAGSRLAISYSFIPAVGGTGTGRACLSPATHGRAHLLPPDRHAPGAFAW